MSEYYFKCGKNMIGPYGSLSCARSYALRILDKEPHAIKYGIGFFIRDPNAWGRKVYVGRMRRDAVSLPVYTDYEGDSFRVMPDGNLIYL